MTKETPRFIKSGDNVDAAICHLLAQKQQPKTIAFLLGKSVAEVQRLVALGAQRDTSQKPQRRKRRRNRGSQRA